MATGPAARSATGSGPAPDLEQATTLDDVARAAVSAARALPDVIRVGLAVVRGAGRELVFVASDTGALDEEPVGWCRIDGLADVPLAQSVRTGVPVRLRDATALGGSYPHLLARQVSLGTRALATYPLLAAEGAEQADDPVLGGLLLSFAREQEFEAGRDADVVALAQRTADAVARTLRPTPGRDEAMLARGPRDRARAAGLEVGHRHVDTRWARSDGWAEVLDLPDGGLLLAVGRSPRSGHAAGTAALRAAVRRPGGGIVDPDAMLATLRGHAGPDTIDAVVAVVDAGRTGARVATAGGAAALGAAQPDPAGSPVPRSVTAPLAPGDLLVLVSAPVDGGSDRALLASARTQRLDPDEVCTLMAGRPAMPRTIVAARVLAGTGVLRTTAHLRPARTAPREARRLVQAQLQQWSAGALAEAACAAVSELVTNAVIHVGTAMRLSMRLDAHRLLVTVSDEGQGDPAPVDGPLDAVGGRGLTLVAGLCDDWGSRQGPEGTAVWFSLRRPGPST